jgi:hypothetical protein
MAIGPLGVDGQELATCAERQLFGMSPDSPLAEPETGSASGELESRETRCQTGLTTNRYLTRKRDP